MPGTSGVLLAAPSSPEIFGHFQPSVWHVPVRIDRSYYYSPGMRFGASRLFDHERSIKILLLYFSESLSWPSMVTAFFFSLLEKHSRRLVMCLSNVGTRKKSRFGWLSPLQESPVSRHRSRSVVFNRTWALQGQHSRRTIHLMLEENACLDNKVREWSDERLSSRGRPSGVVFRRQAARRCIDGRGWPRSVCQNFVNNSRLLSTPKKHTIYRNDKGIKL